MQVSFFLSSFFFAAQYVSARFSLHNCDSRCKYLLLSYSFFHLILPRNRIILSLDFRDISLTLKLYILRTIFTNIISIRIFETTMGWLRLVGALKVQVSFAKEPYKRDDILQKRPIILRRLLIVATPYSDRPQTPTLIDPHFGKQPCSQIWLTYKHWKHRHW